MRVEVAERCAEAVTLLPWARIRRERTPTVAGFYILHEGFIAVQDGRLHEVTYSDGKTAATTNRAAAWEGEAAEGWAGLSDKYWLTALTRADGGTRLRSAFRHVAEGGVDRWQVDVAPPAPVAIPAGAADTFATRLFAGAKEVQLLDRYADTQGIQNRLASPRDVVLQHGIIVVPGVAGCVMRRCRKNAAFVSDLPIGLPF